jgi:hypothetical protein
MASSMWQQWRNIGETGINNGGWLMAGITNSYVAGRAVIRSWL